MPSFWMMSSSLTLHRTRWKGYALTDTIGNYRPWGHDTSSLLTRIFSHFEVNANGASPSVEVVASLKCMTRSEWEDYVLDPSSSDLVPNARKLIRHWIQVYLDESIHAIEKIETKQREGLASGEPNCLPNNQDSSLTNQQSSLLRRWTQIKNMCENALHNLS